MKVNLKKVYFAKVLYSLFIFNYAQKCLSDRIWNYMPHKNLIAPLILITTLFASSILYLFPVNASCDSMSVSDFIKLAPSQGHFKLNAYVVKKYSCPACPVGTLCKPCMQNNILLSDQNIELDKYPDNGNFLIVYTEQNLNINSHYQLEVEILDSSTNSLYNHDLKLIGFVYDCIASEKKCL